jgi:hypothetical protein
MSWELEHLQRRGWNRRAGSPVALIGFVVGLLAMSTSVLLYYWLFAPVATLAVTAVFALASVVARRHSERLAHVADGALAATVFAIVFAVVGAIAVAN